MIKGSCLCGGVKFEIRVSKGPFELCHCNRCRKVTGSAFAAGFRVRGEDLRIVQGQELKVHCCNNDLSLMSIFSNSLPR
jgi:hypothetical protein